MVWRKSLGGGSGLRALAALAGVALAAGPAPAQQIRAERIATGLARPVAIVAAPGRPGRVYVAEQHTGRVRPVEIASRQVLEPPLLDVDNLATGGEQGLLGLAFHPDFESNGFVYVNFTRAGGDTVLRRYRVSDSDPDVVGPEILDLLVIDQPQPNHNAGWIDFGPDGYLYMATGDGGGANDTGLGHTEPGGNAQDLEDNLLGKILRLDVDEGLDDFPADPLRNYGIPPDNPLVGVPGDDEIWAWGLRNPFRCSFDALTGALYCGDVGQAAIEEIDYQPPGLAGVNYGWRLREGSGATPGSVGGDAPPGALPPIFEYPHSGAEISGNVVTGGVVYRGPIATLEGMYFFADYAVGRIWSFRFDGSLPEFFDGSNVEAFTDWHAQPDFLPRDGQIAQVSTFGVDLDGNVYFAALARGEIYVIGIDVDGDGHTSLTDICPEFPDADQLDTDGNGIGNACECGDQNGDGTVDVKDILAISAAVSDPEAATSLCDTNADGLCDVDDILGVYQKIFGGTASCRPDPMAFDRDGDGVPDGLDVCPVFRDPDQADRDRNGIGDLCECGDQSGDGTVDVSDLLAISAAIFAPEQATPLCDTNEDRLCDVFDILGANGRSLGRPAFCSRYPSP